MNILLISDIHGNFPALQAVVDYFTKPFDLILNGGDTTVYAPFPNETIDWLRANEVPSILGNTDRHVLTVLSGRTFDKPKKAEKRIMYGWTAAELTRENRNWLKRQPLSRTVDGLKGVDDPEQSGLFGMFHGSPADPDEFLFPETPHARFKELARMTNCRIVTVGHSHTPFHKIINDVHFINPGSVGRMFDGDPRASCAVIRLEPHRVEVDLLRIPYQVDKVIARLRNNRFPQIYQEMYLTGRKLN